MWKGSASKGPMRTEGRHRRVLLIKHCCNIMSATLLRYLSVLVSAGWPGEIIFYVGYTCVHFQSVLWNTTRSL